MIDRQEVIKLLASYWLDADDDTLNRMDEDVIINVIPVLYVEVRKVVAMKEMNAF